MPSEIHHRLTEQMTTLLKAPALPHKTFIEGHTSYQDVYELACGLVAALAVHDTPAQPVCLYTEDRALTAAAILAATTQGAPQLLLPYALNPNVLLDMHAGTGAIRVITDRPHDLPSPMVPVESTPQTFPLPGLTAASMDKVIVSLFTGGSTGTPQVWPKTVGNLFGEAFFMAQKFSLSHADRFVSTTVPYHIYGLLFAVIVPLVASASVTAGTSIFPDAITDAITRHRATLFAGVPVHYRALRSAVIQGTNLRLAISSAGRLEPEDGAAFYRQTGVGVTEIYGSTETGGVAARNRANHETSLTPLESVETRITNDRLYVRSPYLSPNLETDAEGFFMTGDRVQVEADGSFVLMGRADGIVKVGGKRVDLEGVQACLKELPGIADALVLSLPAGRSRENEIVAVVEGEVDAVAIRQALASNVETYALPRRIIAVNKIPMSAAGKYDRQAAADLFAEESKATMRYLSTDS